MCLNAGAMGRLDAESETLIPVNRCGFDGVVECAPTLRAGGNSTGGARPYGTDADTCESLIPCFAIQERAVCENPDAGPDGIGCRGDGAAYTLEARQQVQAVVFPAEMSGTQCASAEEVSPVLSVGHTTAVAFDMRGREGGAMPEGPHDTANIRVASGGSRRSYVPHSWAVRRLTPTECARLQGFPDDWARIAWRGKPADQCPDGPQYKSYGNSMAVNCMIWLGERISAVNAATQPRAMTRAKEDA